MLFEEHCNVILEESQLIMWVEKLKKAMVFAFSIKTDNLDGVFTNLVSLSFSLKSRVAAYIPLDHDCLNSSGQISHKRIFELLKPLLEDEKILKVGQNMKFNYWVLQNYGIELRGIAFDTMIESYILDSIAEHHDISSLSNRWLKRETVSFGKISKKRKQQLAFNRISIDKSRDYTVQDVNLTMQLHLKMWPKLQQEKGLLNTFQNIEMPLIPVLARMERDGVKIDPILLHQYSKEIAIRLNELKQTAYCITGMPFNLSSTKQLQVMLFKNQKIKSIKKTLNGAPSTSEEVLKILATDYPLPKIILEYRRLSKLKSAYADKLPLRINPETNRVHTSYHQAVTVTGRLSSTNPNLQNIPVRNKEGRRIRQAFIAQEDYIIVSADYLQIELRIMSHLSRDKGLSKIFSEGKDIHCMTAAEVFNTPLNKVTKEQRHRAKVINFGLIYGMSAFGLSRQLYISCKESQKYIDLYFEHYPGILEYIERTRSQAREKGYVETVYGRRLYLPNIKSNNIMKRSSAERAAINAPMQGTAADIIKRAMIILDRWLKKEHLRARMIMQVHDELVFEIHKDDFEIASKIIQDLMENNIELDVPLLVRVGSGENWDQAH